ncbi:hypothetical protein IQ268_24750 [Oculatella sp. LEGE 06141]|uniref:hypothetical protein n=1 Tax=Oculatella sp. LEGE 06141 TaxID=1828648 RepID=UPI00187F67CF|nr:hypothetical protein [Oculatella sp. LEGE 06141]MBE9181780.1 hypothetical protein [Oculatella sp. LEGE 06141]
MKMKRHHPSGNKWHLLMARASPHLPVQPYDLIEQTGDRQCSVCDGCCINWVDNLAAVQAYSK